MFSIFLCTFWPLSNIWGWELVVFQIIILEENIMNSVERVGGS